MLASPDEHDGCGSDDKSHSSAADRILIAPDNDLAIHLTLTNAHIVTMPFDGGLIIGLVSLVGLVSLYSTCLDIMGHIHEARKLGDTGTRLYSRYSATLHLLEEWGKQAGIHPSHGVAAPVLHQALTVAKTRQTVFLVLGSIESIFADHEKLVKHYGLQAEIAGASAASTAGLELEDVKKKVRDTSETLQKKVWWYRKARWAIVDKSKFETLVAEFEQVVQTLYNIVLVGQSVDVPGLFGEVQYLIKEHAKQQNTKLDQQLSLLQTISGSVSAARRAEVLDWIGATTTIDDFHDAMQNRVSGTCEWILSTEQFAKWKDHVACDPSLVCLWITGKPGFGKTYLAARIVEVLTDSSTLPTIFFFCRYDDEAKRRPINILASFVDQLASARMDAFQLIDASRTGKERRNPTEHELWTTLGEILKLVPGCRFVIDGFDECLDFDKTRRGSQSGLRSEFLERILVLLNENGCRLLLVSRDETDIKSTINQCQQNGMEAGFTELKVSEDDTKADVERLARHIVVKQHYKKSESQRAILIDRIASKAAGMFLWVHLERECLRPSFNIDQLLRIVEQMPSGLHLLDQTYARSLENIRNLQEWEDRLRAVSIIRWLMYASRPLRVGELIHAVTADLRGNFTLLEDSTDEIDAEYIEDWMLRVCSSLVETKPVDDEPPYNWQVQLVHFSVEEYLKRSAFLLGDLFQGIGNGPFNHCRLVTACLSYITMDSPALRPVAQLDDNIVLSRLIPWQEHQIWKEKLRSKPFLPYAAETWTYHYRSSHRQDQSMIAIALQLFTAPRIRPNLELWLQIYHMIEAAKSYERPGNWMKLYIERGSDNPLYYLALEGLAEVMQARIVQGDISQLFRKCGFYGSPLHAAAIKGHENAIHVLLEAGASVETLGGDFGTALQAAAYHGQGRVVHQLLQRGASANSTGGRYGNSLQAASAAGHRDIVKALLSAGAEVNIQGGEHGSALIAAGDNNHEKIVQDLLQTGATTSWTAGNVPWGIPFWQ